jgi:hypothetical protein
MSDKPIWKKSPALIFVPMLVLVMGGGYLIYKVSGG